MPKRKSKDRESEDRERKIARYERKLARYREQSSSNNKKAQTPELDPEVESVDQAQEHELDHLIVDQTGQSSDQGPPLDHATSEPDDMGVAQYCDEDLDSEFLSALGESANGIKQYGEEIHKEIFNTIHKILLEGMQKQNKDKLLEKILIPSNCKLLDAPKLNIELLAVLNNAAKSRDKLLEERQQEIGLSIGSIFQVIHSLAKNDLDKFNITKILSDVSRILGNLHYQYTEIRRRLLNPSLDKNLVESLKDNKREEFIYSNLDNSVKSYSAMKRASNVLKSRPVTGGQTRFTPKNFQQPPRRMNPNQVHPGRGSYRGATHHRYNPRQPYKLQDNRPMGAPTRGRAKYP